MIINILKKQWSIAGYKKVHIKVIIIVYNIYELPVNYVKFNIILWL